MYSIGITNLYFGIYFSLLLDDLMFNQVVDKQLMKIHDFFDDFFAALFTFLL